MNIYFFKWLKVSAYTMIYSLYLMTKKEHTNYKPLASEYTLYIQISSGYFEGISAL